MPSAADLRPSGHPVGRTPSGSAQAAELDDAALEVELEAGEPEEAGVVDVPLVLLPESEPPDGVLAVSPDEDEEPDPFAAAVEVVPAPRESVR
jgi:hypothetical protein